MGAALVASMGSVVSCTDAEEDRFAEFQNAIARDSIFVREVFSQQYDSLQALRVRLAAVEAMCRTNCQNIQNQLAQYVTIATFNQYQTNLNNTLVNYYTKAEVESKLASLNTDVQNLINQAVSGYVKTADLTAALQNYFTQDQINTMLSQYATNAQIAQELLKYYTKQEVDAMMAAKANASDVYTRDQVYTKAEVQALINAIVIPAMPDVYTKTEVDNKIKDFIKSEDVVTIVLAQVQDAQSAISQAITNNVMQAARTWKYGSSANQMTVDQLVDAVTLLETTANKAKADAQEALTWVNNNKQVFNQYGIDIEALKTQVANLGGDITNINTLISNLQTKVTNLEGDLTTVQTDVQNIKNNYVTTTVFNELSNTVAGLQTAVTGLTTKLTTVETTANEAYSRANANKTAIQALRVRTDSVINVLNGKNADLTRRIDSLATEGAALATTVETNKQEAERLIGEVNTALDEAKAAIKQRIDSLANVTNLMDVKFNELTTAYQAADTQLQNQINDLSTDIATLDAELTNVKNDLLALTNTFRNTMAKLITSVIIQGTENPILGEAALPVNLQSNILAGYFGYAKGGVTFPSIDDDTDYAFEADFDNITAKDMAMLGNIETVTYRKNEVLIGDNNDNAGTVYLTINPNTANFEGTKFELVNSRDEAAGITLGAVKPSTHTLKFGYAWTRANNAFYEAPAMITNPAQAMPKFDLESAKEAAKAVKEILARRGSDKANATTVAKALAENMRALAVDRYGVKATWTDDEGEHSAYSNYNVAAVAMRGMSFGFAKEYQFDHIPGIGKFENLIGKVIDKIKVKFPRITKDIKELPTTQIKLINLSNTLVGTFNVTVNIPLQNLTLNNVPLTLSDITAIAAGTEIAIDPITVVIPAHMDPATGIMVPAVTKTYDKIVITDDLKANISTTVDMTVPYELSGIQVDITDQVNAIYQSMQTALPLNDLNSMITWLNEYLDDAQRLIKFYNKYNDLDPLKDKLFEYLDKISNKFGRFFSPNKYLQPVMFVRSADGIGRMSQGLYLPTVSSSNTMTLIPTSWTAEIIAPAFKKFIAVTNVYDSADLSKSAQTAGGDYKSALDAANTGDFKKVLNGDRQKITFQADSRFNGRGYIYEVLYSALDYDGKIVARKFYVKVK